RFMQKKSFNISFFIKRAWFAKKQKLTGIAALHYEILQNYTYIQLSGNDMPWAIQFGYLSARRHACLKIAAFRLLEILV
ncbi:MAG: hypothetical protein OXE85_05465, partial [Roseovarius sp.]|nr:hypothetical protein [Roseovarius sp.]